MVAQHGIEDGDHPAHAGGEGDLFVFTGLDESNPLPSVAGRSLRRAIYVSVKT